VQPLEGRVVRLDDVDESPMVVSESPPITPQWLLTESDDCSSVVHFAG
jgi:hypothetical protein